MRKVDYKHGKFTIATTNTDDYCMEDYVEYKGEYATKETFEQWCLEDSALNWDNAMEDIKNTKAYNIPVVIRGQVKRWDGLHEIYPVKCNSVYDAINRCYYEDYGEVNIMFDDGKIIYCGCHHDGTDTFEICALSAKGLRKENFSILKDYDIKRLPYLYAID